MHLSYSTVCRLILHHLLFFSSFGLLYDEVRHQERFESIPFIFRRSYTFKFTNNLRVILGSNPGKFESNEAQQNVRYSYRKVHMESRIFSYDYRIATNYMKNGANISMVVNAIEQVGAERFTMRLPKQHATNLRAQQI